MPLEVRILDGARAGQREVFDKSVIAIGRHPLSDLRFDPERDLDVSARHAEIRGIDGRYVIHDNTSTNGTFVNGERALPDRELHDWDRIRFGADGPQIAIHIVAARDAKPRSRRATGAAQEAPTSGRPAPAPARPSTGERVAVAVREHTRRFTLVLVGVVVVLAVGVGLAFWLGHRSSESQLAQLRQMLRQNEAASTALAAELQAMADTNSARAVERRTDSLRARIARTPAAAARTIDSLKAALQSQHALATMDITSINAENAPAVALLYTEIKGKAYGATAFAITAGGLLVTNRHNVEDADGTRASRIAVTFRDTKDVWPAHIVKVSDDSTVDLALLQMDRGGPFPVVHGINRSASAAPEGAPVVTIGFPLATDLPMEGTGANMIAKTTLDPGTVSKRLASILQIDSYAAHGSSGSPVFDAQGNVVGVVYGGPREGGGRIVFAVPAAKLAAFLPPAAAPIVH